MKEILEQIFASNYTQYKGKGTAQFGSNVVKLFERLDDELKKIAASEGLLGGGSTGRGRWAEVPWNRIFDKRISPNPTNGVYIVYLFSNSGHDVFLTLNQGVGKTQKMTIEEKLKKLEEIEKEKKSIQENISPKGFNTNRGVISELGEYKSSTIFFKKYNDKSLPSEEELKKDLKTMIGIYKDYIESKGKILIKSPVSLIKTGKNQPIQKILFGAPGTGKSFKIDDSEKGYGLETDDKERKFRTTFHPDYDYAQFVGAYKPKEDGGKITYAFVPQVFAKTYVRAWKDFIDAVNMAPPDADLEDINAEKVYLVIEEINRGNCAQIFGDIFQLLDRDDSGASQYSIDADCDFATWLKEESVLKDRWADYEDKVGEGKLKLPSNLNILATMNTSDQSLFPMDSAFKRRFDWEYVPIKYAKDDDCGEDWKADKFQVVVDKDFAFNWLHFLKKVNADISKVTESEDKQMGEFFIKPKSDNQKITLEEFRSKVLFYLWDTVYKDETGHPTLFHFDYKGAKVTFQRLFQDDFKDVLKEMLTKLDELYKEGDFASCKIMP